MGCTASAEFVEQLHKTKIIVGDVYPAGPGTLQQKDTLIKEAFKEFERKEQQAADEVYRIYKEAAALSLRAAEYNAQYEELSADDKLAAQLKELQIKLLGRTPLAGSGAVSATTSAKTTATTGAAAKTTGAAAKTSGAASAVTSVVLETLAVQMGDLANEMRACVANLQKNFDGFTAHKATVMDQLARCDAQAGEYLSQLSQKQEGAIAAIKSALALRCGARQEIKRIADLKVQLINDYKAAHHERELEAQRNRENEAQRKLLNSQVDELRTTLSKLGGQVPKYKLLLDQFMPMNVTTQYQHAHIPDIYYKPPPPPATVVATVAKTTVVATVAKTTVVATVAKTTVVATKTTTTVCTHKAFAGYCGKCPVDNQWCVTLNAGEVVACHCTNFRSCCDRCTHYDGTNVKKVSIESTRAPKLYCHHFHFTEHCGRCTADGSNCVQLTVDQVVACHHYNFRTPGCKECTHVDNVNVKVVDKASLVAPKLVCHHHKFDNFNGYCGKCKPDGVYCVMLPVDQVVACHHTNFRTYCGTACNKIDGTNVKIVDRASTVAPKLVCHHFQFANFCGKCTKDDLYCIMLPVDKEVACHHNQFKQGAGCCTQCTRCDGTNVKIIAKPPPRVPGPPKNTAEGSLVCHHQAFKDTCGYCSPDGQYAVRLTPQQEVVCTHNQFRGFCGKCDKIDGTNVKIITKALKVTPEGTLVCHHKGFKDTCGYCNPDGQYAVRLAAQQEVVCHHNQFRGYCGKCDHVDGTNVKIITTQPKVNAQGTMVCHHKGFKDFCGYCNPDGQYAVRLAAQQEVVCTHKQFRGFCGKCEKIDGTNVKIIVTAPKVTPEGTLVCHHNGFKDTCGYCNPDGQWAVRLNPQQEVVCTHKQFRGFCGKCEKVDGTNVKIITKALKVTPEGTLVCHHNGFKDTCGYCNPDGQWAVRLNPQTQEVVCHHKGYKELCNKCDHVDGNYVRIQNKPGVTGAPVAAGTPLVVCHHLAWKGTCGRCTPDGVNCVRLAPNQEIVCHHNQFKSVCNNCKSIDNNYVKIVVKS